MEPRDATQHIAKPARASTPSLFAPCHAVRAQCSKCFARDAPPHRVLRKTCILCNFIGCPSKNRSVTTRIYGAPISKAACIFIMNKKNSIAVGKYLLSPLTREQADGRFGASVSIQSGSHDRVMRFIALFDDAATATQYAVEQGLQWVRARHANPSAAHA